MEKYKLKNGITLIFNKTLSKSAAIEITFKAGSNNESKKISGISHFLEHMLFEGTKKRASSREIANEIEKYGAQFNAYTAGDRTSFFIKIINKRFEKALDILSDMVANSLFDKKNIEKYGGQFNAYTSGDRTSFFIKIINKRFEKALDILSDMVANPLFSKKTIEKEKQVI